MKQLLSFLQFHIFTRIKFYVTPKLWTEPFTISIFGFKARFCMHLNVMHMSDNSNNYYVSATRNGKDNNYTICVRSFLFFCVSVCVCQPWKMIIDCVATGRSATTTAFTQTTRLWFYSSFTLKSFPRQLTFRPLCLSVYLMALFHFVWERVNTLCDPMPCYTS